MKSVKRYDRFTIEPKSMKETPEGYLTGDAYITRSGVFPYLNQDGSIRYEARFPEDVFKPESVDSAKMLPMTLEHPKEFVNKDNANYLTVGFIGENVRQAKDGRRMIAPYKITDSNAIDTVKEKKKIEISMGYEVVLIKEDGKLDGIPYTHRQTDIMYNHAAIVERGRAGSDVKIIMDHCDALNCEDFYIDVANNNNKPKTEVTDMSERLIKLNLDGVSYQADPEVKNALDKANAEIKKAKDSIDALEAEKKDLNAKLAKSDAEIDQLKESAKNNDSAETLNSLVKERIAVIDTAKTVMGEKAKEINFDSLDNDSIKKAVVSAKAGAEKVENKDSSYIGAYFDFLADSQPKKNADEQMKQVFNKDSSKTGDKVDPEKARKDMMENMQKRSAGGEK